MCKVDQCVPIHNPAINPGYIKDSIVGAFFALEGGFHSAFGVAECYSVTQASDFVHLYSMCNNTFRLDDTFLTNVLYFCNIFIIFHFH